MKLSKMKLHHSLKPSMIALLGLLVLAPNLSAQFTPPGMLSDPAEKASARAVSDSEALHIERSEALQMDVVTSANSEQDAINGAIAWQGDGIAAIGTGSGIGFVSTVTAQYKLSEKNPNLSRLSQRDASVRAILQAKANLMEAMNEVEIEGLRHLAQSLEALDAEDSYMENSAMNSTSGLRTHAQGLVRGAVLYDFHDDPETRTVRVSVVTTPKTRGQVSAGSGPNMIHASDFETALALIKSEIESGVVPPAGGRVVCLQDGSVAYVGFGAELLRQRENGEVSIQMKRFAQSSAKKRGQQALLALLKGEEIKVDFQMADDFRSIESDFEVAIDEHGGESVQELAETEKAMSAAVSSSEEIRSLTAGSLPAGCLPMACKGPEGWVVYAVVYHHQLSGELAKAGREMVDKTFQQAMQGEGQFQINPDGTFKRDGNGELIPVSLGSGRVTQDKDL